VGQTFDALLAVMVAVRAVLEKPNDMIFDVLQAVEVKPQLK
jgi:hypothetical protein